MQFISIFIAGAKDLREERTSLKALVNDLNAKYAKLNLQVSISMTSYENFGDNQHDYNEFIAKKADIIIFVIDGKIGKATEAEYRLAAEHYHKNARPKIITFLHLFDKRTSDIEYIETMANDCKCKYNLDYYVDYINVEDLIAKAKDRIDEYVQKNINKQTGLWKANRNRIKLLLFSAILVMVGFFAFYLSDNKHHLIFQAIELPASFSLEGIDKKFVSNKITEDIKKCGVNSQKKFNSIITALSHRNGSVMCDDTIRINSEIEKITHRYIPPFLVNIRRMIGCKDLEVSFKVVESDSSFIGKVEYLDNNKRLQVKTINERKSLHLSRYECATALIDKSAAFIALAYEPIVSALYDYTQVDGLEEYQMISPWKDCLFFKTEREDLLRESANKNSPNAEYCLLLLGDYFEKSWLEQHSPELGRKAYNYYGEFMNRNNKYQQQIRPRLLFIEDYIKNSSQDEDLCLPDILLRNGIISNTFDCEQLIIVTDEEELNQNSKKYYKATLYSYEKIDGCWNKKSPSFKVNIGVKGIAVANEKVEGDLKTPSGMYPIPFVFGSQIGIETKMNFIEITKDHVWICDTASADYNKLIIDSQGKHKNNIKNEKLYRADNLYKCAIAIGYNMSPTVPGKGSAIFIHIERSENHRTAGCISMSEEKIIDLIQWLDPDKKPHIYISKSI